jgi:uncharacterized protein (DUF1778 family)
MMWIYLSKMKHLYTICFYVFISGQMENTILTRFSEEEANLINEALEVEKRTGASFSRIACVERANKILKK